MDDVRQVDQKLSNLGPSTRDRIYRNTVKPRLLFFAVEDKFLDEETYYKFLQGWREAGYPVLDCGGGVFDVPVEYVVEVLESEPKIRGLNRKLSATVLVAARKVMNRLGG